MLIGAGFAGGGGASTGIEWATGQSPTIAINHNPEAIAMHAINHPSTVHYCESIRAAWQHGLRTRDVVDLAARAEWPRDAETGELHAAHEAGRALIACELVGRGK